MNDSDFKPSCLAIIAQLQLEKAALRQENARLYLELVEARKIARELVDGITTKHCRNNPRYV